MEREMSEEPKKRSGKHLNPIGPKKRRIVDAGHKYTKYKRRERPETREIAYEQGITQREISLLYEVGHACQEYLDRTLGKTKNHFTK